MKLYFLVKYNFIIDAINVYGMHKKNGYAL